MVPMCLSIHASIAHKLLTQKSYKDFVQMFFNCYRHNANYENVIYGIIGITILFFPNVCHETDVYLSCCLLH